MHPNLTQRPVHFPTLAQGVAGVGLALDQQEVAFGVRDQRERTLAPRGLGIIPRPAVKPTVIRGVALSPIFALLIDDRRTADDGSEAVCSSFREAGYFAAITVAQQNQLVGIDRIIGEHSVEAAHDVPVVPTTKVILVGSHESSSICGAA